jgi:Holliday junction resolvase RusA-like endonuclease
MNNYIFKYCYVGDVVGVNHYYQYTTKAIMGKNKKIKHIPIKYVTSKGKMYVKKLMYEFLSAREKKELVDNDISLGITYRYKDKRSEHDLDNILKPIQDALIGVIIKDDKQIVNFHRLKKVYDKTNPGFDIDIILFEEQYET